MLPPLSRNYPLLLDLVGPNPLCGLGGGLDSTGIDQITRDKGVHKHRSKPVILLHLVLG
jgi:hypothetical protein